MKQPILFLVFAAMLAASLLAACGGGGYSANPNPSNPNPSNPTPAPSVSSIPQSGSTTVPLSDVGAPIALPDIGPFEGFDLAESITLPSNNAPAGTNALISVGALPSGVPDPDPSFDVDFGSITLPVTVTFTGPTAFLVSPVPSDAGLSGGCPCGVEYYDPTVGAWKVIGSGEITYPSSTNAIEFSEASASFTLTAGVTYSLVLTQTCPFCYADRRI